MNISGEPTISNLRKLPSVDEVLQVPTLSQVRAEAGESRLTKIVRRVIETVRAEVLAGDNAARSDLLDRIVQLTEAAWQSEYGRRTRRVINAAGVVIHTNLGRAPLSQSAVTALAREAAGYCTVEYDLAAGKRGGRGERAETLICQLTGAESALVVNNCAAAAFLVLSGLAAGGEVVISRGELVEIGGDFRIPDVLAQSGAVLREVGTTNRTKISDYENAVGVRTAMLLRVHPSNYKITGFTALPTLSEMAGLARARGLVLYEDAGSGALIDLTKYGLADEPVIVNSIAAGVDVVSFSGDKLLGGPQAGIIAGRRDLVEKLRRNPLYRALRVGKLAYAALEATLESYALSTAERDIPVLRMLALSPETLKSRTEAFCEKLRKGNFANEIWSVEAVDGVSVVGGGAAPDFQPASSLIAIRPLTGSAAALERRLRTGEIPVIARLRDDRVLIDLRTIDPAEEQQLLDALAAAGKS